MMIIKWRKDETEDSPVYQLYAYTESDYKMQIGWIFWDESDQSWYMNYNIPRCVQNKYRKYNQYTIEEINDVLFRAVLDIQSDLSFINNMCVDYCNAISDYVIDYVQGIDHNEN